MPRFVANLTMLFNEVDFLDRFAAAAAAAGFHAVEYLFPYGYEKDQLAEKLAENGPGRTPPALASRRTRVPYFSVAISAIDAGAERDGRIPILHT